MHRYVPDRIWSPLELDVRTASPRVHQHAGDPRNLPVDAGVERSSQRTLEVLAIFHGPLNMS